MGDLRIVLVDLETLPNLPAALEVWPQLSSYPGLTLKASISTIICFGYKVYGVDKKPSCVNAWDFPSWKKDVNDDYNVCKAAYEILKDADCIITHNGKRFDWRFLQTRLLYHNFPPLPKIHHVDTCAEAKKHLYIFNNRLNTVAKFFTSKEKVEHDGWPLWVRVHKRDIKAMHDMQNYCKGDIEALEAVFKKLRPLTNALPNHSLMNPFKEKVCPKCGSSRVKKHGKQYSSTKVYQRYLCMDCGGTARSDFKDELLR